MSRGEKIGLLANLERCKAQQRIHLGKYDATDHRGVYELFWRAYGDESLARKAQARAAEAYMEQCCQQAKSGLAGRRG